ncbi:COG4223 family protein [Pseudaestuariivita atlantica]|uniref:COG4223 family protein n=1 Tax=Pseudaestuariivita atlantica TaxID=1317121 RepID=UPI00067B0EC2|nr:hypothetical protein [Pseudaestuariivita atlantica]
MAKSTSGASTSKGKSPAKPRATRTTRAADADTVEAANTADTTPASDIIDAEIVEETPAPDTPVAEAGDDTSADIETPEPDPEEAEKLNDAADAPPAAADASDTIADTASMATEDSVPPPPPPPATVEKVVVEKRGGFVPLVLGGIVAAGLGYAASYYDLFQQSGDVQGQLDAQSQALSDLSDRVSDTQSIATGAAEAVAAIDLTPLSDASEAAAAQIAGEASARAALTDQLAAATETFATLGQRLDDIESRLTTLEKKPIADNVSREAIAAYEKELADLQAAMAAERGAIEELLAQQKAEVARIAEEASQMEERALAEAKAAAASEALARVQLALDSGTPFDDALTDLSEAGGVDVPSALSAVAEDGVATLAALQADYPDAARAALRAARSAGESGDGEGFLNYLQAQVGARSVTPQEGNSVDAILSRAEAAVKVDALDKALTEIEALPASSRAELAQWEDAARARLAAISAAADVAARLN